MEPHLKGTRRDRVVTGTWEFNSSFGAQTLTRPNGVNGM